MEGVAGVGEGHRLTEVKARRDKMVGLVETMLKLHKDLPKAKTPHVWADSSRPTADGSGQLKRGIRTEIPRRCNNVLRCTSYLMWHDPSHVMSVIGTELLSQEEAFHA